MVVGLVLGPQVVYNITRKDIDQIDSCSVVYCPFILERSKSRSGQVPIMFVPDEPQKRCVCDWSYMLTPEQHNKLCLLRGLFKELFPNSAILGRPLCSVVRLALFLCVVLPTGGTVFCTGRACQLGIAVT